MITQKKLKDLLSYNEFTGNFTWINPPKCKVQIGDIAGYIDPRGYVQICLCRGRYLAHRLVWLYVHGKFPENYIDHINGIKSDNKIQNLREASPFENSQNIKKSYSTSKTGALGAYARNGKFVSQIQIKGKRIHLGYFDTKDEAHKAYIEAKRKYHAFNTL